MLRLLNPQYRLGIIPYVEGSDYTLRLPNNLKGDFLANEDSIYSFAARDNAIRKTAIPKYLEGNHSIKYTVKNGDYLGKIAKKFGVSTENIKKWNQLESPKLKIGQRLTISPKNVSSDYGVSKTETNSENSSKIYKVKKGDSLWSIAKKYPNISLQQLKEWNPVLKAKQLKPGTKLKLYKS